MIKRVRHRLSVAVAGGVSRQLLIAVACLVIGVMIGWLGGRGVLNKLGNRAAQTGNVEDIFANRSAVIQGQVTRIDGEKVLITNNAGRSGQFGVGSNITVFVLNKNSAVSSPSADLKKVELNKPAIINLVYQNGEYQVVSISMLPAPGVPVKK